jgi:hypothetical protein
MNSLQNVLLAAAVTAAACGVSPRSGEAQQKNPAAKEISASLSGLTLSFNQELELSTQGQPSWILTGRSSGNLADVKSFVSVDLFGQATLTSARTFEIALDKQELHTLLGGTPLFVTFVSADAKSVTASVTVAPRLSSLSGGGTLNPVFVRGMDSYRGHNGTTDSTTALDVTLGAGLSATPAAWTQDASFDDLALALESARPVFRFDAAHPTDRQDTQPRIAVSALALTTQDAATVWPAPTCEATTQQCLDALPFGAVDAAACGSFADVRPCRVSQVLPRLNGQAIGAAQKIADGANAKLGSQRVALTKYFYDWSAAQVPSLSQQTHALLDAAKYASPTLHGQVTLASLNRALTQWRLTQLLPSRTLDFESDPTDIARIDLPGGAATGLEGVPTTVYVLTFPNSGTVVAVELSGVTP